MPFLAQALTPKLSLLLWVDVSDSNQSHQDSVRQICVRVSDRLMAGDMVSLGQFAEGLSTDNGQPVTDDSQKALAEERCPTLMTPREGVADTDGTHAAQVITRIQTRAQATEQPLVAVLPMNAAEPTYEYSALDTHPAPAVQSLLQNHQHVFLILIGVNTELQQDLSELDDVDSQRFFLCTYDEALSCVNQGLQAARQQGAGFDLFTLLFSGGH